MSFSLNEVDATAKKAARGAGHSWGIAEDAGKATRWLCGHGFDGTKALALVLADSDGANLKERAPNALNGKWHAAGGALCPLLAGAALCDSINFWQAEGLTLQNVGPPIMILPFLAMAAQHISMPISATWGGVLLVTDGQNTTLEFSNKAELLSPAKSIKLRCKGQVLSPIPRHSRANPTLADWDCLNAFAARTYAPATAESREKGAGAGLSDND